MKQVTQPQYDERYYHHEELVNKRTKTHWFPSVTYIQKWSPANPQLMEWIGNKGWEEAERIKIHRGNIGTYVHNALELMIKDGKEYTEEIIDAQIFNEKEALFVKRCLLGAMNWMNKMKEKYKDFEILEAEGCVFGNDYAGTIDLVVRMGGVIWVIDFKTSKSLYDSHRMQVNEYRLAKKAKRCALLQLGNRTKQRYTFSEVAYKDGLKFHKQFKAIKELFYLAVSNPEPTVEEFPELFTFNPPKNVRIPATNVRGPKVKGIKHEARKRSK
jgi:hypothetical protein